MTFDELVGTRWSGTSELWLDPLGDEAARSECTLTVERRDDAYAVLYTWAHDGVDNDGSYLVHPDHVVFTDAWHKADGMRCARRAGSRALFDAEGSYAVGDGPEWGWGSTLSFRTMGPPSLVLQMTNIAPWGEHGRAVRMILTRDE